MNRLVLIGLLCAACGPVDLHVDEGSPNPPASDVVKPILVIPKRSFPAVPQPPPPPAAPAVPADCAQVRVVNTGGDILHVRPDPSTTNAPVGQLNDGQTVTTLAIVDGEAVNGDTTWYQIDAGGGLTGFITGAYSQCVDPNAPPPVAGFMLPLACGATTTITQGNNGPYSHTGYAYYAFDFGIPRHTPLMAIDDGTVIATSDIVQPGGACWSGGGQECANTVNYVLLQHADGTASLYMHLDAPTVNVGDAVSRGQQVGWSGGTGWSTGPHAHLQRQQICGSWWCQSVQTTFADFGGGIPQTGDTVTSGNCP